MSPHININIAVLYIVCAHTPTHPRPRLFSYLSFFLLLSLVRVVCVCVVCVCFLIAMLRYTHAGLLDQTEDVPFRLTRNMSTLMSPMLVEVSRLLPSRLSVSLMLLYCIELCMIEGKTA